jgi:hypothetical protein
MSFQIDDTDKKILNLLMNNARVPFLRGCANVWCVGSGYSPAGSQARGGRFV